MPQVGGECDFYRLRFVHHREFVLRRRFRHRGRLFLYRFECIFSARHDAVREKFCFGEWQGRKWSLASRSESE